MKCNEAHLISERWRSSAACSASLYPVPSSPPTPRIEVAGGNGAKRKKRSFSFNISTSLRTMEVVLHGMNDNSQLGQILGSTHSELDTKDVPEDVHSSAGNSAPFDMKDKKEGQDATQGARLVDIETSGDVNMEASISPDDVACAGGLGARDNISSFLPVASDATDFEEALLKAQYYEGPQGDVSRPGLGWTGATH